MSITSIMTTRLITVTPNDTIETLHNIFKDQPIHHLLVVDGKKLVGIISDRDVLKNISPFVNTTAEEPKDRFTLNRKASQIMNTNVVTVKESTAIIESARVLLDNKVSLLPVMTRNNELAGVLSWKDVMKFICK